MNFDNLKISDFIEAQLPDFIAEEYPSFVNFFQEYYKSLEIQGGPLDLSNNFLNYIDTSNLGNDSIISTTTLVSGITASGTTIQVSSIVGFAETNGIILIDEEIIFYQSVDKQNNQFLNCARGYSAVTEFKDIGTKVTDSTATSHSSGSKVKNLSNLITFAILKHYQNQYLKGFPYTEVLSNISEVTLIENIKEFYQLKGTSTSVEFLFRAIFNDEIIVRYPRELVIKSSDSDWTVDDIIKVEAISGDPTLLIGQQIYQTDKISTPSISTLPEPVIINNVTSYYAGTNLIYELRLNILTFENFVIPKKTFLRRALTTTSTTITVDSTLGFPEFNGVIQVGNELIFYKNKSYCQFFECNRGILGTTPAVHIVETFAHTTEYLYGYVNGDTTNPIQMRLVGLVTNVDIKDGGAYYSESDIVNISPNGVTDTRPQFQGWRINENGNVGSSSILEYNKVVSQLVTEVSAVYKDDNYAYIASTGLPVNSIGPFEGLSSSLLVGNQYNLKRIPLVPDVASNPAEVGTKGVGIFKDGVEAYSAKSSRKEIFGDIASINVLNPGYGFNDSIPPNVRVIGGGGSGALLSAKTVNGVVTDISVVSGGTNYTSSPTLEVAYGFDATAAILSDGDIVNGSIQHITVTSGGTQYIVPPEVQIFDATGVGKGAYAVAVISGGTVTRIDVLTGGLDYKNKSTIVINLISSGRGVETLANTRTWNYDRTFTLDNVFNPATGRWEPVSIKKTDQNNGYLFTGLDDAFGLAYAYPHNPKALRYLLNDNVRSSVDLYAEVATNFVHSPIIGWAYDGNPIYGPYGYADPATVGNIKRLQPSYVLRIIPLPNRPNITSYPLGSFIEDYAYINGAGDLDNHNGRFCVTPEYPEGVYAYFLSVDSSGTPVYPYIIGPTYNSNPATANFLNQYRQSEEYFPLNAKRLRTSKTPIDGFDASAEIADVARGSVTTFLVKESQAVYKVGDYVYFDNTDTEGSGAYASVETVTGTSVSGATYAVSSGSSLSGVSFYVGSNVPVFPDLVSAPAGNTIKYDVFVTTISGHNLVTNDKVFVNVDINAIASSKTFRVRVTTTQIINYTPPSKTTALAVGLPYNEVVVAVNDVSGFSYNDYIKINDEIMQIVSINANVNQLTVNRGTPQKLHSAGDSVSLYIYDADFDYRLNVGQTITSGSASGTITKLDKDNKLIEIKLTTSSQFLSSSVIYDNSLPIPGTFDGRKQIIITSVSPKNIYWEIDPTNTGLFYRRNLTGVILSKGNRYVFDVSDPSNNGYLLSFSKDSNNNIGLYNIGRLGVAGTSGATVVLYESNSTLLGITRVYYYELNNLITNNQSYFDIKPHQYEGFFNITAIDSNTFKYQVSHQPEPLVTFSGISYYTYSNKAIGKINSILTIDGGKDYKKLPSILGVTHIDADLAQFTLDVNSGVITNVFVTKKGNRYSNNTTLVVVSPTGGGAILTPTILNGQITSVRVDSGGSNYTVYDTKIIAVDKSNSIIPLSDTIGKIRTVKITNTGSQLNTDRSLSKTIEFGYNLIVSTNFNSFYANQEYLTASNGAVVRVIKSYKLNDTSYFVKVKIISGLLTEGISLIGNAYGITSTIEQIKISTIFTVVDGYSKRFGYYASDAGKLNSYSQKITDSFFYQDFSYVIRSSLSTNDYKQLVYNSTHPAGFKLFGEVGVESYLSSLMKPVPDKLTEISILSSYLNVKSQITEQKYQVSLLNTTQLTSVNGTGSAINDIKNKELDVKLIDNISSQFINGSYTYSLNSSNNPLQNLYPFDALVLINELVQEPVEVLPISQVSVSGAVLTVTTTTPHKYAHAISGITYPLQQYVTLSGLSPSKLNDKYQIFNVPSSNSFGVLFNNTSNLSGVISSGTTKIVSKGTYNLNGSTIGFVNEVPKDGSDFYSVQYKFFDAGNTVRYCYKLQNLLFDGVTTAFDIRKTDGTLVSTEPDENLLIFLDDILQEYGTGYTIDRDSLSPTYKKIIFSTPPTPERKFFGFSFSKYKIFDDISSQFNDANKIFNIEYNQFAFKIIIPQQLLVVLDGVVQRYGDSYTIKDSIITFNEPPKKGKSCKLIYFYGKTFDKKFYIYNQDIYSNIIKTGVNEEGCSVYNKSADASSYISPGDKIEIDGESAKEIISFQPNIIENLGTKEYVATIYNDDSFVRGKNAVATAVLSGILVTSGVVTSGIGYISVNDGGIGYDVAPVVIFKSSCTNPGRGASAKVNIQNGKISSIDVVSTGSGYTIPPEIIITKGFKIIRSQYPIYQYENSSVILTPYISYASLFNLIDDTTKIKGLTSQGLLDATANILSYFNSIIKLNIGLVDDAINPNAVNGSDLIPSDAKALKLGVKLVNFFDNRFAYQPKSSESFATNNGLTVGQLAAYMPKLTIQDVSDRPGSEKGADFSDPSYNFGLDSYVTFGTTLASGLTASGTTVYLNSTSGFRGNHNYFRYSEQLEQSSWIRTNSNIAVDLFFLSPNGVREADVVIAALSSGVHGIYQDFDYAVSGVTYTFSCYGKNAGFDYMKMTMSGATDYGYTYFNVATASTGTSSNQKVVITPTIGGWYRYSVTQTATSNGKLRCGIYVHSTDNQGDWTGDNIMGVFAWGVQLEANPQARIYIKSQVNPSSDYNFPIFIGNELIRYTTISGNVLLNCTRGPNAYSHTAGDYVRVAWED